MAKKFYDIIQSIRESSPDGSVHNKEKVITVRHKDSGKELRVVATAAEKYKRMGYEHVKEEVKEEPKPEVKSGPGEIYSCKSSDTYNSVAKLYSITVKELKTLNGIKNEQMEEGMELKVDPAGDYTEYDKKKLRAIMKKLQMHPKDGVSDGSREVDGTHSTSPVKGFKGY